MQLDPNPDGIAGIKYATLIASFLGAAVSLSYAKEMTRVQAISAVAAGTAVAVAGAPLALHYLGLPDTFERGVAFFAGLVAMRAVPAALAIVDRVRHAEIPHLPDSKED
ncbi:hypothetical protein ASC94_09260 [Massilia sp. Root418]|uniref:hypothetical protein n=1 Tax=Massilia sp. Root418 TaxID=1736532 RepID=UPI0006F283A3|nr:hypothetical protein [Massilia sp. Root418]KQW96985.1 hypothetical protein ASC94_09260 [Massilia sp. Root418]